MINKNIFNERKSNVLLLIKIGFNIYDIVDLLKVSFNTVRNYISKYKIRYPYSFYQTTKKFGRKKGYKLSEEERGKRREKINFKGKNNPFYNKTHSEKTKKKMSDNHADFKGNNNPFKNKYISDKKFQKEFKQQHLILWEKRDKEWRSNFGKRVSKGLSKSNKQKNRNLHRNHKSGFYKHEKCGKIFFRSSWERVAAEQLSKIDIVDRFKLEPFYIVYYNESNEERYSRIDFFIILKNNKRIIMEVKPKALQKYGNNKFKIKGYKEYCSKHDFLFLLFDEEHLNTNKLLLELGKYYEN